MHSGGEKWYDGGNVWGQVGLHGAPDVWVAWPAGSVGEMLLGEHEHTIDDKGRLTLPSKYREKLADGVVVTKGTDSCLWLYPKEGFRTLEEKINGLSPERLPVLDIRRLIYGSATSAVPDRQNRINLPQSLRTYANLQNKAVIIGLNDHCEIWQPDKWQEQQAGRLDNPDWRAQQLKNLAL